MILIISMLKNTQDAQEVDASQSMCDFQQYYFDDLHDGNPRPPLDFHRNDLNIPNGGNFVMVSGNELTAR